MNEIATSATEIEAPQSVETPEAVTVLKAAADAAATIASDVKSAGATSISRLKSWPMWLGIAGAVWMFISALGIPSQIGLASDTFNTAIGSLGAVLVAFGAVNNPTTAGLSTND